MRDAADLRPAAGGGPSVRSRFSARRKSFTDCHSWTPSAEKTRHLSGGRKDPPAIIPATTLTGKLNSTPPFHTRMARHAHRNFRPGGRSWHSRAGWPPNFLLLRNPYFIFKWWVQNSSFAIGLRYESCTPPPAMSRRQCQRLRDVRNAPPARSRPRRAGAATPAEMPSPAAASWQRSTFHLIFTIVVFFSCQTPCRVVCPSAGHLFPTRGVYL